MGSIFKYLWRSTKKQIASTLVILLSLSLIAAIILINLGAGTVTQEAYEAFISSSYGTTDLTISSSDTASPFFSPESICFPENTVHQFVGTTYILGTVCIDGEKEQQIRIWGADPEELSSVGMLDIATGTASDSFSGNQMIISERSSELLGEENKALSVSILGEETEFLVCGTAKQLGVFYDDANFMTCVVPRSFLNTMLEQEEQAINIAYIDLQGNTDRIAVKESLAANNRDIEVADVFDSESVNTLTSSMSLILLFSLVLILYLSSVVIYSLYRYMLEVRAPVMATFRSLGASKVKTALALYAEALLFGVLGASLGIAVGALAANGIYQSLVTSSATFESLQASVDIGQIALTVILTIGWAFVTTSASIRKASKISIKQSLFQTLYSVATLGKTKTILGILFCCGSALLFAFASSMALMAVATILLVSGCLLITPAVIIVCSNLLGNIVGSKRSFSVKGIARNKLVLKSIVILSLASGLVISILGVLNGVDDLFNAATSSVNFDVIIGVDASANKDYDQIEKLDSVGETFGLYLSNAQIDNGTTDEILLMAYDDHETFDLFLGDSIKFVDPVTSLQEDEILLDEKFAQKHNYHLGEFVTLCFDDTEISLKLVGVVDSFRFDNTRRLGIISKKQYLQHFDDLPETIYALAENDVQKAEESIRAYLLDTTSLVKNKTDFFAAQKKDNDAMLRVVELAMLLGMVVSCFGIINNIVINYIARKKEFAILLSTSTTKHQLKKMLMTETAAMVTMVLMIAVVSSRIILYALGKLLESADVYLRLSYPWDSLYTVLPITAGIMLVSLCIPFGILKRMNVYQELRTE